MSSAGAALSIGASQIVGSSFTGTTVDLDALDIESVEVVKGAAAASLYGSRAAALHGSAPWSRHDLAFAASAGVLLALVVAARLAGVASFAAYPSLHAPVGPAEDGLAIALIVVALLPFADRRGIER